MRDPARFIAMYVLLGVTAVVSLVAFGIGIANTNGKASKADVAAVKTAIDPSRERIVQAACKSVVAEAASQGVINSSCKLAPIGKRALETHGDRAQAVLECESRQQRAKYAVVVELVKGMWSPVNVSVEGMTQLPKA